jgi:hypothetical protein
MFDGLVNKLFGSPDTVVDDDLSDTLAAHAVAPEPTAAVVVTTDALDDIPSFLDRTRGAS